MKIWLIPPFYNNLVPPFYNWMKAVFYKSILEDTNLSPTDMIVYCQMLYLSLMDEGTAYRTDGKFDTRDIEEEYNGYIQLSWRVSIKYISGMINSDYKIASMKQCYLSLQSLKDCGYLVTNQSGMNMLKLVSLKPYFELKTDTELRGLELIVYSYIANKESISKRDDGWVDKYHNAIAKDLNLPMSNEKKSSRCLERILYRLAQKGYLKRSRHGSYRVWLKTALPGER